MMGILCFDPYYIYGDNKSVLYNTTLPDSTLKKKSNSIAYHLVREGAATGEWITGWKSGDTYISDLLTKPVPADQKITQLVDDFLYDI